jgi:hypothetical protein
VVQATCEPMPEAISSHRGNRFETGDQGVIHGRGVIPVRSADEPNHDLGNQSQYVMDTSRRKDV